MTAYHAATVRSVCNPDTSIRLPESLMTEMFNRLPIPVVVGHGCRDLFLNHAAHRLWPIAGSDPSRLRVLADGKEEPLLTLLAAPPERDGSMPGRCIQVPGAGQYEVDSFTWTESAGSDPWRAVILQPQDHNAAERNILTDKVTRLKAIVHEFRNTLTAAREALAILDDGAVGELNPEQRRFLDSAIEDLGGLVRALVDLASLWVTRAGVFRMVARPVCLEHVVQQGTVSLLPAAKRCGISLHIDVSDPSPTLTGDKELLVQALRNVLTNAIRHTPTGGRIHVRAFTTDATAEACVGVDPVSARPKTGGSTSGECVVIEVRDSGDGIDPVDRKRVFLPLERGKSGAGPEGSASEGGMGLGLTIARDIASTHGGTLELCSSAGRGSCFVFRFPKSENCVASWMARATQRAIDDIRPLGAPLAVVLLRFETDEGQPLEAVAPSVLSAAQQIAIKNLRSIDTVLAIGGQLLLLIRGSSCSAAYAMFDRLLQSLAKMHRPARETGNCRVMFGAAAYPDNGETAEQILSHVQDELKAFPLRTNIDPEANQ